MRNASLWKAFWPDASSTQLPERLIGDKANDSSALDEQMADKYGIELIAPNRRNRRQKTQDGRQLRRYCKRWKVERLFAWMHNFRRLVTRWEYHVENFLGFVRLACIHLLLRHL
jgi:transposase